MTSTVQYPTDEEYGYTIRSVRRSFHKKFPTIAGIFIGVLQMLLNGAIIGLEGGSVAYNRKLDIIYAGFWCSISFFFTWASMFAFLCFRKTIRWGLLVVGMNFASIAFAVILIVFDSLFIHYPCHCYLATICDGNFSTDYTISQNCSGSGGKLRVVAAQLACAATMLASNIGYIIIFLIAFRLSRALRKPLSPSYQPMSHSHNSSLKILSNSPMHTSTHQSVQHPSSPNSRYRQPAYPDQTMHMRPPTPYFNRLEKF